MAKYIYIGYNLFIISVLTGRAGEIVSELRYNIINREWVVIATERAKRPLDFKKPQKEIKSIPEHRQDCPFCPGSEGDLSDETFRIEGKDMWKVRSIYNKFPALSPKEKLVRKNDGIYHSISGYGVAEVIIESPKHNLCIVTMPDVQVEDVIKTYKSRYLALQNREGIEAIVIFRNHGPGAGTSLEHPHSQLIATPIVPPQIRNRMESAVSFFDTIGKCMFCDTLEQELAAKKRVVAENESFVSFIPYAGAAPFVTWIFPKRHMSSFGNINDIEIRDMASILKLTLAKLYYGLNNPDFNYTIRSIPVKEDGKDYFHWYLTIVPRISQPAGFEVGSGIFINSSVPEESAEFLRQVKTQ
ncbi:MAG: galactose-1-phosphate uridylyltransferase [Candidatus Omnitrophota bacterium]|nr:galactose-1-phosphate uridylyltransferase [Candidatus Omnitrophota bacterium]